MEAVFERIAAEWGELDFFVVEGIQTSIPLHLKILADPDFAAGRLNTSFMDRFLAPGGEGDGRLKAAV